VQSQLRICCLAGLLICSPLLSEDMETGWIEETEGYKEEIIGAKMGTIDAVPVDGKRRVTVAIPKSAVSSTDNIQEVIVVGRQPDIPETRIKVRYEWAKDFENDYYGLIIYLGKDTGFPIRLYFKGEDFDNRVPTP